MEPMRTGPQNRFSFFDTQLHAIRNVVKPRFSTLLLTNPFLTPSTFILSKQHKTNRMNVLHRSIVKIMVYRASEWISADPSISPVYSFLGAPGIVAERTPVVLIGCLRDPELSTPLTCSRYAQLR